MNETRLTDPLCSPPDDHHARRIPGFRNVVDHSFVPTAAARVSSGMGRSSNLNHQHPALAGGGLVSCSWIH